MISGFIARVRSLWLGIRRTNDLDAELRDEFQLHLDLRAADLVRSGLLPAEAARRARLEFGSTATYKDKARASRGLRRFDAFRVSWLDFKLGARMLVRYPGLTLVGGLALAFAIWVGAGAFEFITKLVNPTIPLHEGDRIVALRNWDARANRAANRVLHDFTLGRERVKSVEQLGAYRLTQRNMIVAEGGGEPVEIAEISPSAFPLTRVPPILGRTLVESDQDPQAPPVLVIGHDFWQSRFRGDSAVIGRSVQLSNGPVTIVGVMPPGYAFPFSQRAWSALRLQVTDFERGAGPSLRLFGRLAPEVTLAQAQAELTAIGQRTAAAFPQTNDQLRPQVIPYARAFMDLSGAESAMLLSSNLFLVLLLVLVCSNVALLMFARAATRSSEIVVRTALGASRGRIIMQLFAEALVLGCIASVVGLAGAGFGIQWGLGLVEADLVNSGGSLPFWFDGSLSPATIAYAAVLTVLGAIIAGVVPALKVTRDMSGQLKATTAGGGGLRFGGVWTAVIVVQAAATVAFPAAAFLVRSESTEIRTLDVGFPVQEYLSARIEMDPETLPGTAVDTTRAGFQRRFAFAVSELERRIEAEPGVTGVTSAGRLPRMYHPWNQIEVDEGALPIADPRGHRVGSSEIAPDYFDVTGVPLLSGRGFQASDQVSRAAVVIVNREFVDSVLGGKNPIGRRVRYLANEGAREPRTDRPWFEIIGVAPDIGMKSGYGNAGIYHVTSDTGGYPVHLAVHLRGDPAEFVPRLRVLATAVSPALRVYSIMPLDEVVNAELQFLSFWFQLTVFVSAIALLLSLAGIYAVMSFTVSRRTREIGVRVALGADRRRVVSSILRRPLMQVAAGIGVGGMFVALLTVAAEGESLSPLRVTLVVVYAAVMLGVCMLACIVPARRALRIQPTEALRAEG